MELKIYVATTKPLEGDWYEVPSRTFEQKLREWEETGKIATVLEVESDIKALEKQRWTPEQWNQLVKNAENLPEEMVEDLDFYIKYEPFETIVTAGTDYFFMTGEETMVDAARFLVTEELAGHMISENELMMNFVDYRKVAKVLQERGTFFQTPHGIVQYMGRWGD